MRKIFLLVQTLVALASSAVSSLGHAQVTCGEIFGAPSTKALGRRALSIEPYRQAIEQWASEPSAHPGQAKRKLRIEIVESTSSIPVTNQNASTSTNKSTSTSTSLSATSNQSPIEPELQSAHDRPTLHVSSKERLLKVPSSYLETATDGAFQKFFRQLLIGTSLHPYVSNSANGNANGKPRTLRRVQAEGILAGKYAQKAGLRKFLFVSPTGTGKSEVFTELLKERALKMPGKLHIASADYLGIVDQLAGRIRKEMGSSAHIIEWGGDNEVQSLEQLIEFTQNSDRPVILVSTMQTLRRRFIDYDARVPSWETLFPVCATFAYDEAHHAGAEQAEILFERLIDHPKSNTFLIGTTATPVHHSARIDKIFEGNAFWAYLDSARTYVTRVKEGKSNFERPLEAILDQLEAAIDEADLTPFDQFHILQPRFIDDSNAETPWRVDDPKILEMLKPKLAPLFAKHKRGFITVPSTQEAERVAAFLREQMGINAQAFYSGMSFHKESFRDEKEIEISFREGKIDFLVTVRKLDEGLDFPDLSLFIDLNRTHSVRQLLQRIGRVLRVNDGKEGVDIAVVFDFDRSTAEEMIKFLTRVEKRGFSGLRSDSHSARSHDRSKDLSNIITELKRFWKPEENVLPFEEAWEWASQQRLRSRAQWSERLQQSDVPPGMPLYPDRAYEGKGWTGWADFLRPRLVSYEKASEWARREGIKTHTEWKARLKKGSWPPGIPRSPAETYRGKGWTSWPDFLGTQSEKVDLSFLGKASEWAPRFAPPPAPKAAPKSEAEIALAQLRKDRYWTYEKARQWALAHGIKNIRTWIKRRNYRSWPKSIPRHPEETYRHIGWKDWDTFLAPKESPRVP